MLGYTYSSTAIVPDGTTTATPEDEVVEYVPVATGSPGAALLDR